MDFKLELVAVPVSTWTARKAFYTEQAGFNADHDHQVERGDPLRPAHAARLGVLDLDRDRPRGERAGRPAPPRASSSSSPDINAARCRARGARRRRERRSSRFPWGDFVFFQDPDGNGWAVQAIPQPLTPPAGRLATNGPQRPGRGARALQHRPAHGLLPRRLLQHRPRRPRQPHDLRGRDRRVPRAPAGHRQRPGHADAGVPLPRPRPRRPLVRHRRQLAARPPRGRGRLRRARLHARAGARHRPARGAARARGRRARATPGRWR